MEKIEILLKDVGMTYSLPKKEKNHVLKHIDLAVRKGEFISLLGPSGCGKTTILRLMADLLQPTEGQVMVSGLSAREARKHQKYGMVFQSPVLYEWRTVKENIRLPLELTGIKKKQQDIIIEKQLQLVDLWGQENKYPHELSGGMQQRVGIARALALNPDILLMDEPFSALDEFTRQRLHEDLLWIWRSTGKTIVFVTHNISEAVFLSDRICVLSANPARINAIIDVPLPRPRGEAIYHSQRFFDTVNQVRNAFSGGYNDNI